VVEDVCSSYEVAVKMTSTVHTFNESGNGHFPHDNPSGNTFNLNGSPLNKHATIANLLGTDASQELNGEKEGIVIVTRERSPARKQVDHDIRRQDEYDVDFG